jgi:hypothetical protein
VCAEIGHHHARGDPLHGERTTSSHQRAAAAACTLPSPRSRAGTGPHLVALDALGDLPSGLGKLHGELREITEKVRCPPPRGHLRHLSSGSSKRTHPLPEGDSDDTRRQSPTARNSAWASSGCRRRHRHPCVRCKLRKGLRGLSYIGMIEPALYVNIAPGTRRSGKRAVSWHVHAICWGEDRKQMRNRFARLNQREEVRSCSPGSAWRIMGKKGVAHAAPFFLCSS